MTIYKYLLVDEFGGGLRKFVSKTEAQPYITEGSKLLRLPPEAKTTDPFKQALELFGESPF